MRSAKVVLIGELRAVGDADVAGEIEDHAHRLQARLARHQLERRSALHQPDRGPADRQPRSGADERRKAQQQRLALLLGDRGRHTRDLQLLQCRDLGEIE